MIIDGQTIFDTNQTARPFQLADSQKKTLVADLLRSGDPNTNMTNAHAEFGFIQRAYDQGFTLNKDMTLIIRGQDVCSRCLEVLAAIAQRGGLKSLTIVNTATREIRYWERGMSKTIVIQKIPLGHPLK